MRDKSSYENAANSRSVRSRRALFSAFTRTRSFSFNKRTPERVRHLGGRDTLIKPHFHDKGLSLFFFPPQNNVTETFIIPQNGKSRGGTGRDATPMPRGAAICPFYERPIVKVTRRRAARWIISPKTAYCAILRQCKNESLPMSEWNFNHDRKNLPSNSYTSYGSINHDIDYVNEDEISRVKVLDKIYFKLMYFLISSVVIFKYSNQIFN